MYNSLDFERVIFFSCKDSGNTSSASCGGCGTNVCSTACGAIYNNSCGSECRGSCKSGCSSAACKKK